MKSRKGRIPRSSWKQCPDCFSRWRVGSDGRIYFSGMGSIESAVDCERCVAEGRVPRWDEEDA